MAAEQRLYVPIDPAAVHYKGRCLHPALGFRKVEIAEFGDRHRRPRGMALGRWIGASGGSCQLLASFDPRLIGSQCADFTDRQPPRAALGGAVLDDVGRGPARLHPHPKALERAVAGIPHKHIAAASTIGPDRIDGTLAELRHCRLRGDLLPWLLPRAEIRRRGSNREATG